MRKKIGCFLAVSCAILLIGCGGETRQTGTNVTVQEIPIDGEKATISEAETDTATEAIAKMGTEIAAETELETEGTIVETEPETDEIVVNGNEGTIKIGTIGVPYTELLTQAKINLAARGWDVQIEVYEDYEKMNQDVVSGVLDAHLFAHQTYLNSYNDVNGTDLTSVAEICYEIYGVYSALNQDLTNIESGVTIGIPQDDTKKARVLLFLQDMGHLTLKEGVGLTAILDDIAENPKNIQFTEYTPETITEVLDVVDYCIMGADQAILAGFEPQEDVLKEESPRSESAKAMATLLVTTADRIEDEKFNLLEDAIKSETTKKYVEDIYKGAWRLFP